MNTHSKSFRIISNIYNCGHVLDVRCYAFYTLNSRIKEFKKRMTYNPVHRGPMSNFRIGYFENKVLKKKLTLQDAERIIKLEEL